MEGIVFVGDVHGKFYEFEEICEDEHESKIVQIGDLGIGFKHTEYPKSFHKDIKFIRGNHDNPEVCRTHPNYLGEYGYDKTLDLFFVSGAWSIDHAYRRMGVDIWEDEQLSYGALNAAIKEYAKVKPSLVVSHDCPISLYGRRLLGKQTIIQSNTAIALDRMLDLHKPKLWIFGHHHVTLSKVVNGTRFVCLNELEILKI